MPITSAGTYARAFKAETNLYQAAGSYENTLATKFAKGIVGVLTLGIGYGIFRLIEDYRNVRPKVAEFCANAERIHSALAVQVALQDLGNNVEIRLNDGRLLKLIEFTSWPSGEKHVRISDGEHTEEIVSSFHAICVKLEKDFEMVPGLYDLSGHYRTLTSLLDMSVCKIAPVINFSTPDTHPNRIYESNMRIMHKHLSQRVAEGNIKVSIPLLNGLDNAGEVEFIEAPGRNNVLVKNRESIMIAEDTLYNLCRELETIFYMLDPNDRFKTIDEWIEELTDPCEIADESTIAEAIAAENRIEDDLRDEATPQLRFVDDHFR